MLPATRREFPAANSQGHTDCASDIDPLFCAPIPKGGGEGVFGFLGDNAVNGILRGFVNHSPMCTEHYYESLGGQDHGNEEP